MWWARACGASVVLLGLALAGCSGDAPGTALDPAAGDVPAVQVSETKGAMRGFVVDERIVPVAGATLRLNQGLETTTDEGGAFSFDLLEPGAYVVEATKPGYTSATLTVSVRAGVEPELTRFQLSAIPGKQPYVSQFRGEGFYECALEVNTVALVFTDSCDFPLKYSYDSVNETGVPPPYPRSFQQSVNRWELDVAGDVETYIHELSWSDPAVTMLMRSCIKDLSDLEEPCGGPIFLHVEGSSPLIGRLGIGEIPRNQTVFHFGALSFVDGGQYALNLRFDSFVTLFHNFEAPPGWSMVAGDEPTPP